MNDDERWDRPTHAQHNGSLNNSTTGKAHNETQLTQIRVPRYWRMPQLRLRTEHTRNHMLHPPTHTNINIFGVSIIITKQRFTLKLRLACQEGDFHTYTHKIHTGIECVVFWDNRRISATEWAQKVEHYVRLCVGNDLICRQYFLVHINIYTQTNLILCTASNLISSRRRSKQFKHIITA